jgi:hypothetical protein
MILIQNFSDGNEVNIMITTYDRTVTTNVGKQHDEELDLHSPLITVKVTK